jgi:hypothetical protein
VSAPLKDDLSFSPNPKMVGERNPDSVLFKIQELGGPEDSRPAARGKSEVIEEEPADEPGPPARVIETEEQEKAASSGLVNVQDLLHEEAEAANAIPKEAINPGLIPEAPPPVVAEPVEAIAPPSKLPQVVMVAGGIAVIIAVAALITAL